MLAEKIAREREYAEAIEAIEAPYKREETAYITTLEPKEAAEYLYLQACFRLRHPPRDTAYAGDNAVSAEYMRRGRYDIAEIYRAGISDWRHACFLSGDLSGVLAARIKRMEDAR
jgi:hypothetical protein